MSDKRAAIQAGMMRAKEMGRKLGPRFKVSDIAIRRVMHLGTAEAARRAGLSKAWYTERRRRIENGQR